MKKSFLPTIAICVSVSAISLFAPLGAYAQKSGSGRSHASSSSNSKETYLVIKIIGDTGVGRMGGRRVSSSVGSNAGSNVAGNVDSNVEYKVINTSQYKDEEKRLKDAYNVKLKEWKDLKKTEPTAPMPVKPIIKKIGTPYLTQKVAQEYVDKLKDEEAEKEDPNAKTTRN